MLPKNPGGRRRKYATDVEARAADISKKQDCHERAKLLAGPADFIAYEPPHPDVPATTPPSGLRTSSDIRIPLDDDIQQDHVPQTVRPISPPPIQLYPCDEGD